MKWFQAKAAGDGKAEISIDKVIASDWEPGWVVDFFGEQSARAFIEAVDALGDLTDIHLKINTPGGDVYSAVRITNYLIDHPATVHVTVDGMAASSGSVIMLAGDTRTMGLGTQVMTHMPSVGLSGWFTKAKLLEHADQVTVVEDSIIAIYVARTGKTEAEIRDLLGRGDVYLSADEAIEWGFATAKNEQLKAVACADSQVFELHTKMQGDINALRDQLDTATAAQAEAAQQLATVTAELQALRNPDAAPADDVITACSEAKLEALAVPMLKAKLPMALIQQRLTMAAGLRDVAKAGGIDAATLLATLDDPIQMVQVAITEAKALNDQNLNHLHTPGPGTGKQPSAKAAYAQLNQQS